MKKIFQFTASDEADRQLHCSNQILHDLSIHSLRWGWPPFFKEMLQIHDLSIHSLRWGWPKRKSSRTSGGRLSIHSLRWGWPFWPAACLQGAISFNSQPQMRLTEFANSNYFSWDIFQFTASDEADPGSSDVRLRVYDLSIHSLRWGWPSRPAYKTGESSFNSQPQMRLTVFLALQSYLQCSFNSQPQMRLTCGSIFNTCNDWYFQFTASDEADHHP